RLAPAGGAGAAVLEAGALRSVGLAPPGAVADAVVAMEAVGAGGAATGATGAAASCAAETWRVARATGCERTKTFAGTTVAKRWFASTEFCPATKASRRWAACQRLSSTCGWTWADWLMRL